MSIVCNWPNQPTHPPLPQHLLLSAAHIVHSQPLQQSDQCLTRPRFRRQGLRLRVGGTEDRERHHVNAQALGVVVANGAMRGIAKEPSDKHWQGWDGGVLSSTGGRACATRV